MDIGDLKKGAATLKEQGEKKGGFRPLFTFKDKESFLLILQKDNVFIHDVAVHEVWKNKKMIAKVGSPSIKGEEDPIMLRGWEIKDKFKDSDNDDLKNLWRKYMPRRQSLCRVIDVKDDKQGVQVASLPKMVKDAIIEEVSEIENEEQAASIFDLDKGRVLKVKHNGLPKLEKKFEVVKFLDKRAEMVKRGKADPAEIDKQMIDLNKYQTAWNDAQLQKVLKLIEDEVKYIIEREGGETTGLDLEDTSGSVDDFETPAAGGDDDFDLE